MPKASLQKNSSGSFRPIAKRIRGFIPFSKGISLKVNVKVQVEFKLAYYDVTVQHINHYAKMNFPVHEI